MSENEVTVTGPTRGLMFYLKVISVTVALLAVVGFIAVYYVYYQLTTDSRLEQMVMEKVSSAIKMDVKFESLLVTFPGIDIKNVSVSTDTAELKLNSQIALIKVKPDLWAAFSGELVIDSLSIASAATVIEMGVATTKTDKDAIVPMAGVPFDLSGVTFPFNSVDLSAIKFSITDRSSKVTHELLVNNAGLSRSMLSTAIPFSIDTELTGKAKLLVDGKLYWPSNIIADLTVKAQDINEFKKLIPAAYLKNLEFVKSAEIKSSIKYNLNDGSLGLDACQVILEPGLRADGKANISSFSPLTASATFKIAPVAVDELWPLVKGFVPAEHRLLLKGGRVSADLDIAVIDAKPVKVAVSVNPENIDVSAKALPEKIQLGRGKVRYEDGNLSFAEFEARMSDTLIKMNSGSLTVAPLAFAGEISVEVNSASIWKQAAGLMSAEAKRIVPSGKAEFNGKLLYDKKGFKINGTLLSEQIKISETQTSAKASLEKIKIKFDDLSATAGQLNIESLEIKGVGAAVTVKGILKNAADMGFDITAKGDLSVDEFSRLGGSLFKLPVREGQFKGDLSLDMKLGGTVKNPAPQGRLEFKNIFADMAERGLVIANLNGNASADSDKLQLDKLTAELLGGKLSINGSLNNFKKPVADAKASITGADLAAIRKLIKINYPSMPDAIEFSGRTDLNVNVTGTVAEPVLKGDAELKTCRFAHPAILRPIENINGPVKFTNTGLTATGLLAEWGSSKVAVNGQLKDWSKFITDFKFTVDPLDLTDAAGFFLKGTGYTVEGKGTGSGSITGAVEKIRVDGVASVPVGMFSAPVSAKGDVFKFPYKNLLTKVVYFDKVLDVKSAELDLFSGKVNANGKVILASEPISFEFDTKIKNLMTQEFLAENSSYKDVLQGGLDGTFIARGNIMGLATLNGNASLGMQKGTYDSPPVVKQISQQLNAAGLASGIIENVTGDYVISGGRISSKNVVGKSKDGKVTFIGSIGLDTTLDGEARFQIKRESCQQSNILRELVGNEEFLEIPISLKGSIMSPSVGMPLDRMLKQIGERKLKEALQKEAGKALGKIFGGKSEESSTQTAPSTLPTSVPTASQLPGSAPIVIDPATASAPQAAPPVQQTPEKKLEDKIKNIGKELKGLKNIFKF